MPGREVQELGRILRQARLEKGVSLMEAQQATKIRQSFLAALEENGLAQFSEQKQLAWLQRVAQYKCIDYYRRATRRPAVPLEEAFETLLTDERHSPDHLAERNEEDALLHQRLIRLPEHYQTILQLRFANGLRCIEIARHLNKSEGAVRMLLARALNPHNQISGKCSSLSVRL